MLEVLDICVLIFGLAGSILLIYKNKFGFLCFVFHSICWSILSLYALNYGALLTCLIFIGLDLFGYYKWSQK